MSSAELPERSGAAASVFPAGDSKDAILLQEVSTSLRSNLEIKDRRSFLRTHALCFVGSEAVSFLVSAGHAPTRDAAVSLGQRLLCNQFIRGLSNSDGAFLDNSHLFRFLEDEATPVRKAAVSTTRPSPRPSRRIRPPASAFRGIYSGGRSWIESSLSSSSYRVQQKNRSMDGYDPWYHHDEIASSDAAARTQSLVDEQRAARLRKSSFCPIESILAVAPTSTVGFSATCSFYFSPHTTHHSIALTVPIVTAMKTAFSSHNMHARETSVHMLRNQVLKAADASDKNWMYLKNITGHHGNDVRIFCRTAAGGVQTVLTVGPVHVAPSTFVQHFLDPSERRKMDALFESSQTVEDLLMAHRRRNKLKQNTAYVHEVFSRAAAAPWVDEAHPIPDEVAWAVQPSEAMAGMYPEGEKQQHMSSSGGRGKTDGGVQRVLYRTMASPSAVLSARDFVTFQDCFSMDNGAHCVYEISVEHRDIPSKMEHYTRGEVLCLAHIAEPILGNPNASMLTVVTQVGLKGKMPSFVAKLIFDQLIARSFDAQTCGLVVDGASQMETSLRDVPYDRTVPDDLVRRSTGVSTLDDERDAATGPKVGLDDFELLAVLGRGGFAKVMQVRHRQTHKVHAMKILKKEELVHDIQIERTRTERSILAAVEHPFIVALAYAFQDTKRLFMVMDFVQGGDLFAHLRKYGAVSVPRARIYLAEIALAVAHLHALDIVYRDLKPENILVDADGHLKITDFGLSHFFDPPEYDDATDVQVTPASCGRSNSLCQVTHSFCGTEAYMAPEMLLHLGHGKPIDWWCLGIVACEMLTGVHPFRGDSQMRLLSNVVNQDPIIPPQVSPDAANLIHGLLCKQPRLRLGTVGRKFEEIKDHPFFAGLDWDKVAAKGYAMEFVPPIENDFDVSNFGSQYTSEKFSGAHSSACSTSDASSFNDPHHPHHPQHPHPIKHSHEDSTMDPNSFVVTSQHHPSSDWSSHGSQYRGFSGFSYAGPPQGLSDETGL